MAKQDGKCATKVAKAKAKIVKKCGRKKAAKCAALAFALGVLCVGCATSEPASRVTSATYGDINIHGDNNRVTLGDGAISSSDSEGSTETLTATPTLDITTDITAKYNDVLAAAADSTRSTLSQVGGGIGELIDMLWTKKTGTIQVKKRDGTSATVKCEKGNCEFCPDCTP